MLQSVRLEPDSVVILDQTLLPNEKVFLTLKTTKDVWEAIYHLKVRGAPAIGIAAAYGFYLGAKELDIDDAQDFYTACIKIKEYLASSRPTAVNLCWALDRMELKIRHGNSVSKMKESLLHEARKIHQEDEQACEAIGKYALSLLQPQWGILTHCNAGAIATSKYGTALAPIHLGQEQGHAFKVYAGETRPLLQGARLTAWELQEAGVDVTLVCDNMASILMKEKKIQAVIVGCDRIAANGDTANKIGTSGLAILAKHYQIPFYVCAPLSSIDLDCPNGEEIEIEIRPSKEITHQWYEKPMAPEGVKVYNPCFDVTDHSLITAIITPQGVIKPSYQENLTRLNYEIVTV